MSKPPVTVNGRIYNWPKSPLVVICCDGSEPAYMEIAMAEGLMPNLTAVIAKGENLRGLAAMPSFTNPNNLSIVTGTPPKVHGITGNYLIDPASDQETMMNDPKWLRAPTVFAAFQEAGGKVCVITATCFSSERADKATREANGIDGVCELVGLPMPEVYSAALSEFVFAAGVKLVERDRPDLTYLSTTDYIQHKFAPGSKGANDFYAMMDRYVGELDKLGVTLVIVADHGMKDKHKADGSPDVLYLQDALDAALGVGKAKVILPITDPYVAHHGALGSYATVYLNGVASDATARIISSVEGVDKVLAKAEACTIFDLPEDRIGDLVVISGGPKASKVIGTSRTKHDLSGLDAPLRSHGGLTEQEIPVICNRKLRNLHAPLRNFDAFFIGCNNLAE
jgi:phosphonoacetate hydrolase